MNDETKKAAAEGEPKEHKHGHKPPRKKHPLDGTHHRIPYRTVETDRPNINNHSITGEKGTSIHHFHLPGDETIATVGKKHGKKDEKKADETKPAEKADEKQPETKESGDPAPYPMNVNIYLLQGDRNIEPEVTMTEPDNPTPPATYEPLEGIDGMGYGANPIRVEGIMSNEKVIRAFINMKGAVYTSIGGKEFKVTDVITDSKLDFFEGMTVTEGFDDPEPILHKYPVAEKTSDDSPYIGYHDFDYDENGNLTGEYDADAPMYFPGDFTGPIDSNGLYANAYHGPGYPNEDPGQMPISELPQDPNYPLEPDTVCVAASFEGTHLGFNSEPPITGENGEIIQKHRIVYHVLKKKEDKEKDKGEDKAKGESKKEDADGGEDGK